MNKTKQGTQVQVNPISASVQTFKKVGTLLLIDTSGPLGMREWQEIRTRTAQFQGIDAFCLRLDGALVTMGLEEVLALDAAHETFLPGALVVTEMTERLAKHYAMDMAGTGRVRGVFTDRDAALSFAVRQGRVRRAMVDC